MNLNYLVRCSSHSHCLASSRRNSMHLRASVKGLSLLLCPEDMFVHHPHVCLLCCAECAGRGRHLARSMSWYAGLVITLTKALHTPSAGLPQGGEEARQAAAARAVPAVLHAHPPDAALGAGRPEQPSHQAQRHLRSAAGPAGGGGCRGGEVHGTMTGLALRPGIRARCGRRVGSYSALGSRVGCAVCPDLTCTRGLCWDCCLVQHLDSAIGAWWMRTFTKGSQP